MLIHIGSKPTLVASSAESAREIMKTHDVAFANRPKLKVACKILYGGNDIAFSSHGEYWRQLKSLCVLHVFSNTKVRSFRRVREEEAAEMAEKIRRLSESLSGEVNLSEIFASIANDVVCRAAFGRKYTGEEGCANIKELLGDFSEALGAFCMQDFIPWLGWIDWVSGVDRKATKVAKVLDGFIEKIVQEHLESQTKKSDKDDTGEKVQDFVDILLEIQKENSHVLPRESIKAVLMDILAGGTDTTYTLLEWAMTELLRHPRVMKELQEEVRGSIQGKTRVWEDDVKNMKYLKAVIKETLRLHPPLPLLLFRKSSEDVKIKDYDTAAGTQVIVNAWAIQRDSAYWEEAEEFQPERFLKSSVDFKGQHYEYIPFGAGRRGCPGMSFGIADAELALATLAYEFDWKLPQPWRFGDKRKRMNKDYPSEARCKLLPHTLLEWAMTELLRYPRVMKELQDEVRGSIRGKTGVDEDDLKNMKYLKAVLKETLRLHPSVPLLLHESSHDIKIKGYDIAAGTQVIINAWAIQRDSAYWEETEEFRPERFLNSSVDYKGQNFEFIPFGAGRRSCAGMTFAIADAELIIATLAYEFDWKLPEGCKVNVVESGGSFRKRDPLVAIPTPTTTTK